MTTYKYFALILQVMLVIPGLILAREHSNDDRSLTREKRQSVSFPQPSYSFTTSNCIPGTIVGTVNAPGATYYTIDRTTPNVNIGMNINTGQVLLINYIPPNTPVSATVRTYVGPGSTGASATTRVTVTCSNSGGSGSPGTGGTGGTAPVPSQPSYFFTARTCTAGSYIGQVFVTNSANVVFGAAITGTPFLVSNTGQITVSGSGTLTAGQTYTVQVTATNPYGTTTIPVTISSACSSTGSGGSTTSPSFPQSAYFLTATSCSTGSTVGTLAITNPSTGTTYTINQAGTGYQINPQSGTITMSGNPILTAGAIRAFSVTASNSFGVTTAQVTITATCSGGGGTGTFPSFTQNPYFFTATSCTGGAIVGTVSVTNPTGVSYSISPTTSGYSINPTTGAITVTGSPQITTGSSVTLTVFAQNSAGQATSQVTIQASCSGGSGSSVPQFLSGSYSFTASGTCTAGTTVGAVSVTTQSGQVTYSSSNPAFTVSSSGLVTLTGNPTLTSGSRTSFTITATNNLGSASVPITVFSSCSGSGGSGFKFQQPNYFFTPILCGASATVGTVNTIGATGPVTYSFSGVNPGYSINSAGTITAPATGVVAGTLTIVATTSTGQVTTAPLIISAQSCSSGGGGSGSVTFSQSCYVFKQLSGCTLFANIGSSTATSTSGVITYSIPTQAVNNFGIDPNTGIIYDTVPNTQCNLLNVVAKNPSGSQATVPVYVDCTVGGTATCTCPAGTGGSGTGCVVGTFGCADIG